MLLEDRQNILLVILGADGKQYTAPPETFQLSLERDEGVAGRIRTKLNAGNKAELTRRAIDLGYVPTSPSLVEPSHARPALATVAVLDRTA